MDADASSSTSAAPRFAIPPFSLASPQLRKRQQRRTHAREPPGTFHSAHNADMSHRDDILRSTRGRPLDMPVAALRWFCGVLASNE
jgi:hypothetical protein